MAKQEFGGIEYTPPPGAGWSSDMKNIAAGNKAWAQKMGYEKGDAAEAKSKKSGKR